MRWWFCVVLLLFLIPGCQPLEVPRSPTTVPSISPQIPDTPATPEPTKIIPDAPANVTPTTISESKEQELHIIRANVFNIGDKTVRIEFETNIPSVAIIRLLGNETEIMKYGSSEATLIHCDTITNLKPAYYTAVIDVQNNNQNFKKVVNFDTFATLYNEVEQPQINQLPAVEQGIITAQWYSGDGSIKNSIWTFEGSPGVNRYCTIRINNQTARYYVIETRISNVEIPLPGESGYSIDAHVLEVPPDGIEYITLNAIAQPDAPQGIYKFYLKLIYHYFGEFVLPIEQTILP